jgi:hypothetical protein
MFIIYFSLLVPVIMVSNNPQDTPRNTPKCKACKLPMKGHKNLKDCPKTQISDLKNRNKCCVVIK